MVAEKDRSALPTQKPWKVDCEKSPILDTGFQSRKPIETEDVQFIYSTGEPGDVIDWHTHMPDGYQINMCVRGRRKWYYIDNDGNEQTVEIGPNEVVFLPGGMENKVEIVGDEENLTVEIHINEAITRVEQLLGIEGAGYDMEEFKPGLEYDHTHDEVVQMDEDAVID